MSAAVTLSAPNVMIGKRDRELDNTLDVLMHKRRRSASLDSVASHVSSYAPSSDDEEDADTPLTPQTPNHKAPSESKIFACPYEGCDKAYNRPARLKDHINSHTRERPHICPHKPCEKSFLRQSHLAHHIKSAHTAERNFTCSYDGCDKSYVTGTRLRRHISDAHEGKEKFQCTGYPGCSKTFRKKTTLQNHIDLEHLNRKPFRCTRMDEGTGEECEKAYLTEFKLLDHQRKHHDPMRFTCAQCPLSVEYNGEEVTETPSVYFATSQDLAIHIQQVHPPHCESCDQSFSTPRELVKHVEALHSGKTIEERRTFRCSETGCDKAFTKQSNLNQHFRTVHEGSKRFVCGSTDLSRSKGIEDWNGEGACHETFSTKQRLESHVRGQHLGQKQGDVKNRKQRRQEKKGKAQGLSTIGALTGNGYANETGRDIECVVRGCEHRFYRRYDLELHAQTAHGMDVEEVLEAIAEQEALNGGRFWIGGIDPNDPKGIQSRLSPFPGHYGPETVQDPGAAYAVDKETFELGGGYVGEDGGIIDPMLF